MASTIRDVAKLANVSIATVSRVLNQDPVVSQKTIQRVQEAMLACNYVPNSYARNLKSNNAHTVGFLVSNISNSYFTSMAKVIEDILLEHGFNLIICSTNEDPGQELSRLNYLQSIQAEGVILNTTNFNNQTVVELSKTMPIVLLERSISGAEFRGDFIGSNNFAGIKLLTEHLLSNGHRKIALINCGKHVSTGRERFDGFWAAMAGVGIEINSSYPYVRDCDSFSIDNGFQSCRQLLNLPDPPTALIATNNTLAIGALRYVSLNQISIPDKLSFMSYGNIENSDLFFVGLSHATLNPQFIGEKAANCILSRIGNPSLPNREVTFEPALSVQSSVSPLLT
ncbi:LacI family DNA-binding transcriptional regulator [Enterocloster asparagiformis]|uniref:LacI family DNA-binding transcriptional regulator n=1 Tax=Enterocloster asparagiformis TaxID=333367 RepID=UPI00138B1438|nr:LacI family DNA-binding transcriptional regulator [Enterocloster asparagiformis]